MVSTLIALDGSCRCGAVHFSVASHAPCSYQLCYCSICRKRDGGGGGVAINIMGDARTLKVRGRASIRVYHARIREENGRCTTSRCEWHFCSKCASALWVFDPEYQELVHPFASAIDTELPSPPWRVQLMLTYKPDWVKPDFGQRDAKFQEYPKLTIEVAQENAASGLNNFSVTGTINTAHSPVCGERE